MVYIGLNLLSNVEVQIVPLPKSNTFDNIFVASSHVYLTVLCILICLLDNLQGLHAIARTPRMAFFLLLWNTMLLWFGMHEETYVLKVREMTGTHKLDKDTILG